MSKGYSKASDGEPKDYEFISLAPAGSLASTGADMARFMIAHLQNGAYGDARILREDTARMMHTTGQASIGPLHRMMLGFYRSEEHTSELQSPLPILSSVCCSNTTTKPQLTE